MKFESIARSIPGWLAKRGPVSDVVLSSRARIARNIEGIFYAHRADEGELEKVVESVLDASSAAGFDRNDFFRNDDLSERQRIVFIERHLISPALASNEGNRGVLVKPDELDSIMVNEEDHLRIQTMRPGFDPEGALEGARGIEDRLSNELTFSHSREYGYLTACPTNMGTGLRLSVLIHLPALVLTKEIQKVIRSAGQLGMAVRGYHGEGSDIVGNLFQISNQISFGKSENEIAEKLTEVVNQIIHYERNTSEVLMKEARAQVEDKIWRSVGILKTARMLSAHEFMNLASAVRLGLNLRILDRPPAELLNELMILTQPGHLQELEGKELEALERDARRASLVRERFIDVPA